MGVGQRMHRCFPYFAHVGSCLQETLVQCLSDGRARREAFWPQQFHLRLACKVEAWLRLEGASSISTSSCDSSSPLLLTEGYRAEPFTEQQRTSSDWVHLMQLCTPSRYPFFFFFLNEGEDLGSLLLTSQVSLASHFKPSESQFPHL